MNRDWSKLSFYSFSHCLRIADKRQKVTEMYSKCYESTKKVIIHEYNLLYKRNLSFAAANRPGETLSQPYDYQINFVNIDSCHQYGILGAILQMPFL